MNDQATDKKFIFSPKIDGGFLYSLYEDDYSYIHQVFGDSLEELENTLMAFAMSFNAGNLHDLRRSAHKIKPVFGFTGMLEIQESVTRFEDRCGTVAKVESLSGDYNLLLEDISKAKIILINEQKRLQEFAGK